MVAYYLEARDEAAARLKAFVDRAARASLHGNVFDDAATGRALVQFFLRGLACGALTDAEVLGRASRPERAHPRFRALAGGGR